MSRIRGLWRDRKGVAALEFAMLLPLLVILLIAIIEVSNLHLAGRKATVAAQSAADLAAQERFVNATKLGDIVAAVGAIMRPFPAAGLSYDIASVEADLDGNVGVGWRITQGGIQGGGCGVPAPALNLISTNDSVIAVTVVYQYRPALNFIFGDINITEQAFARPRRIRIIPLQP